MNFLRNHILSRIVCFAFALHIFNVSVDTPDATPDYISEDLSINDMESVVEIVLEQICGIKDAIAEHDEPDGQNENCFEIKKMNFFFQNFSFKLLTHEYIFTRNTSLDYKNPFRHSSGYAEIPAQPPEA